MKGLFLLVPHEEHETSTLKVDGLMFNPCGLKRRIVVVYFFPLRSINMRFCSSFDWVARHMVRCVPQRVNILLASMERHWIHQINYMTNGMSMYGCYMMSIYMEGHGITSCVFIRTVA